MFTGLFLLALAALAAFAVWAWHSLPQTSGESQVPGIAAPVEIWRDGNGVPHIFADSAADAWFALGYVHAQDRMWQMEFMRRLGAGRLAEVLGKRALDSDSFMRTLGLHRLAEAQAEALSPQVRPALEAYTAGVNAWLEHRNAALPLEFLLLGHEPEPWRVADSMVWGRLLAYRLSGDWQAELFRARLALTLPKTLVVELWPGDPPDAPTTFGGTERGASNAWVLGAARTTTGAPILANDPHLTLTAPSPWYLARLVTPEFEVTGATAPGMPFTLLGHNGFVAWGMTSTGADTQDLFAETIDPDDAARYLTPDGPREFATRRETIRVKGGAPVELTVRATRHGPVISDFLEDMDTIAGLNAVMTLASASEATSDRSVAALAAMPLARDADSFEAAAANFTTPVVNVLYADTAGAIGAVTPGRIPVRRNGDGSLPADGADGRQDWIGVIPPDELPRGRDPAPGYLVNANNRLVGEDYPWLIAREWEAPYRARRIQEVLAARERHAVADMLALQNDTLSDAARDLLPIMLEQVGRVDGTAAQAVERLRVWDLMMARDRPEPLIYAAWLRETMRGLAADELGESFPDYWRSRPRFVHAVLTANRHWCGDAVQGIVQDCGPVLRRALDRALQDVARRLGHDIAGWGWGDLHRAGFRNRTLTSTPVLSWLSDPAIAADGGAHTVNRGVPADGAAPDPFLDVHGATYKAVYDLSDLAASRYMMPPGQSGNMVSRHYRDLLKPWRDGKYIRIAGSREALAAAGHELLVLTPGGG